MNLNFYIVTILLQFMFFSVSNSEEENLKNIESTITADDIRVEGARYWSIEIPADVGLRFIGAQKREDGKYLVVSPTSADIEYFDTEINKWLPVRGVQWATYSDFKEAVKVPDGIAIQILLRSGDFAFDINKKYRIVIRNYKGQKISEWGEMIQIPLIGQPKVK